MRAVAVAGLVALPLLGTLGGYLAWRDARSHAPAARMAIAGVSTGQAGHTLHAEGRMVTYPGAEVTVSTEIGGTLAHVAVEERGTVKKGDLLVEFEASEQQAAVAEARAHLAEALTGARFSGNEAARTRKLVASGALARASVDRSSHDRRAAGARATGAHASVRRLEAALAKTRVFAPIDGTVIRRSVQPGETVPPGTQLVTVADLSRMRVEVEVDEFDVGRVVLGADATIIAEGYAGQSWRGRIEEIPDAVAARRLKPQDPARPTDTRVLLVKVALDQYTPLKLGQRVDVQLSTVKKEASKLEPEARR